MYNHQRTSITTAAAATVAITAKDTTTKTTKTTNTTTTTSKSMAEGVRRAATSSSAATKRPTTTRKTDKSSMNIPATTLVPPFLPMISFLPGVKINSSNSSSSSKRRSNVLETHVYRPLTSFSVVNDIYNNCGYSGIVVFDDGDARRTAAAATSTFSSPPWTFWGSPAAASSSSVCTAAAIATTAVPHHHFVIDEESTTNSPSSSLSSTCRRYSSLFSLFGWGVGGGDGGKSSSSTVTKKTTSRDKTNNNSKHNDDDNNPNEKERRRIIGIVGGGLAGTTAAASIARRLNKLGYRRDLVDIIVFEGDPNCCPATIDNNDVISTADGDEEKTPKWNAALAKNANSIAVGASMHCMATRSTLLEIARDTIREWIMIHLESMKKRSTEALSQLNNNSSSSSKKTAAFVPTKLNIDNFDVIPPYFDFHIMNCIGPQISSEERKTFWTFMKHYLITSLLTGNKQADERAKYIVQLAKANRYAFLQDVKREQRENHQVKEEGNNNNSKKNKYGLCHGFLSLHRTVSKAEIAVDECKQFGERATLVSWENAVKIEPSIRNLPIKPLHCVHRPDDVTANCYVYITNLIKRCECSLGVVYHKEGRRSNNYNNNNHNGAEEEEVKGNGQVIGLEQQQHSSSSSSSSSNNNSPRQQRQFRIHTKNGCIHEVDYLILAAGIQTPLYANQLNLGKYCPTYPLRGHSLTLYTNTCRFIPRAGEEVADVSIDGDGPAGNDDDDDTKNNDNNSIAVSYPPNRLNRPISIDNMYCTSIGPNMVRLAGFGEIVGYHHHRHNHNHVNAKKEENIEVASVAPRVMTRYANILFPDVIKKEYYSCQNSNIVKSCYRPMSPDDLPIAGEIGVFTNKQSGESRGRGSRGRNNRGGGTNVFIHNGHGTLGWTLALATSECIAQAVCERVIQDDDCDDETKMEKDKNNHHNNKAITSSSTTRTKTMTTNKNNLDDDEEEESYYQLPDDTLIPRYVLSPDRFVV